MEQEVENNGTTGQESVKENIGQQANVTGNGHKFPTWGDLFSVIGVFVLANLIASVAMLVALKIKGISTEQMAAEMPWMVALVQLITFVPLIFFVMYLRHRAGVKRFGLHFALRRMSAPMILWGVLFVLVSGVVIEPLLNLLPDVGMDNLDQMLGGGGWSIVSAVVAAPVLEELFFRGLVIDSARRRIGTFGAVLVSALLFGLAHGIPQQAFNAFVVGLILGYIYIRTDSLAAVMIIHAVNNALSCILLELFGESDVSLRELIPGDTLYYAIYAVCCAVFIFAMVKLVVTLHNNDEINADNTKKA